MQGREPETQVNYDPHPAYRPEIDGLRAIAVLAVVLYHFSMPGLGGGLVGVDIFFVISGFLIGGILMREQTRSGSIMLGRFYLRRIRRLAPAYFTMAAASLLVAWLILLPFEFREFGKELIASTTYLANIHFFRGTGYFDIGIENKILLHNWSLSVEEQFYLFLPFLILALKFSQLLLRTALLVLFLASLVACVWLTPGYQSAAFYLFPFRAWELLAGVLLAIWAEGRTCPKTAWPSWVGLVLMLAGIIWVQPGAGFPGWQGAVPVAGAVLALAGGRHGNPVNWALSSPIPVFFGRISYSLYLWHWPVLTLSMYWRGQYAGFWEAAAWLSLALGLSVISWRFVEQPVRLSARVTSRLLLAGWAAGSLVLIAVGGVVYLKDGASGRFAPEIRTHIDASADFVQDWSRCSVSEEGIYAGIRTCAIGPEGAPEVLIWGDSHLRPLHAALSMVADEADTPAVIVWTAGCPPFFGVSKVENTTNASEDAACTQTNTRLRAALDAGTLPDRLLLVGRWSYYAEGTGIGQDASNTITLTATEGMALTASAQPGIYAEAFGESLELLNDGFKAIHVLRQPPEIPEYDSRVIAREMAHGRLHDATAHAHQDLAHAQERAAQGEAPLRRAEAAGLITYLDSWPYFCDTTHCSAMPEGQAFYFDNNHLTNSGGIRLRSLFVPVVMGDAP